MRAQHALILASFFGASFLLPAYARDLSFEERFEAQRRIEDVYWRHRIWPKENPNPKPPLSAVMRDEAIRAKVEDSLRKSNALEKWWRRPITVDQLQAELNRMARTSHDSARLRELFDALGNDPLLIAETLARQSLVDRLIRNWYSRDDRFHQDVRRQAEEATARAKGVSEMKTLGGQYSETTWVVKKEEGTPSVQAHVDSDVIELDPETWRVQIGRVAGWFGTAAESLPLLRVSEIQEEEHRFVVTAILSRDERTLTTATVAWPKTPFDLWWDAERRSLRVGATSTGGSFTVPQLIASGCTDDTWRSMHFSPGSAHSHTAIWTGSEMIIWGGVTLDYLNMGVGGRYDPATDTWTPTSTGVNAPSRRVHHAAMWTGSEMIVWGGFEANFPLRTGGRYNPATDTWAATSTGPDVPSRRRSHTAVWTGSEMVIWGGYGDANSPLSTGGRYDPATDTWTTVSTGATLPLPRGNHTAVWTGSEMIVWGGFDEDRLNTGGRYDPVSDTWTATSTGVDVPSPRSIHGAVWTGSEMIVWGGSGADGDLNTGGRYDPVTDTWTATTDVNVPLPRSSHSVVWTGSRMIVWGGYSNGIGLDTGGRYNPVTDTWTATSAEANVPDARFFHTAVWTGAEMIVWGGYRIGPGAYLNTGGRYDPATDIWAPTSTAPTIPSPRGNHTAVWTGSEMVVWGGGPGVALSTGGRYEPATDTWTPTSTGANVPSPRQSHTAVWTGIEIIIWGGYDGGNHLNTGGRYNPATDMWTNTSTGASVPSPRRYHAAVWTGTEMIVWGGFINPGTSFNNGARYNPNTDSWVPTSTGAGVPSPREIPGAVWTGSEMIIWGGGSPLNTGGRYDPVTDTWMPTSTGANVPSPRAQHTVVWTGSEMLVWGGYGSGLVDSLNTGGRYNPATDTWMPMSTGAGVPSPRIAASAVWTGNEMIAWGGYYYNGDYVFLDTGGRYNPATDSWIATSFGANVPSARAGSPMVWTGSEMIVWGGTYLNTGARYCACFAPVARPELSLAKAGAIAQLNWTSVPDATGYDVVSGSLSSLRGSSGDFSTSTGACLLDSAPWTSITDGAVPPAGDGYWYLVRAESCSAGTYDETSPPQQGSRDAEIEASGVACQ